MRANTQPVGIAQPADLGLSVRLPVRALVVTLILVTVGTASICFAQTPVASEQSPDADAEVLHFEVLNYPLFAKVRSIQGVVVLKASTDREGNVRAVTALSGGSALRHDAAENLKKWKFRRPIGGEVVVVYWFRFSGVCEAPCLSGFEFHPPNMAIVTTGRQLAMP